MNRSTLLVAAALLTACAGPRDEDEGIYVGNPSMVALRLADPEPSVTLEVAVLSLDDVSVDRCGDAESVAAPGSFDLLGDERFEVSPGALCGVDVLPGGLLHLEGVRNHQSWELDLELDDVAVGVDDAAPDLAAEDLVLELGKPGWISGQVGPPDSKASQRVANGLRDDAGLFLDVDRNGRLGEAERARGAVGHAR